MMPNALPQGGGAHAGPNMYDTAVARANGVFNSYAMDLTRSLCILMGLGPTVAYRACALLQRLLRLVREEEERRRRSKQPATVPRLPASSVPECVEVLGLRAILGYEDVFHRLDGVRYTDDTLLYYASAAVLIACKLECPQAKIRFVIHAMERINFRRKQRTSGSVLHAATPPPIRVEVYDALKRQVVSAERELLVQLGFQTNVEYPQKYVFNFLSTMLDRKASPETSELFDQWAVAACTWVNDCPRSGDVNEIEAPILACAAIVKTQPMQAIEGLPMAWHMAFGVTKADVADCLERFRGAHVRMAKPTNAPTSIDVELALYQASSTLLMGAKELVAAAVNPTPVAVAPPPATDTAAPPPPPQQSAPPPPPPPPATPIIDIAAVEDISVKRKQDKREKRDKKDKHSRDDVSEPRSKQGRDGDVSSRRRRTRSHSVERDHRRDRSYDSRKRGRDRSRERDRDRDRDRSRGRDRDRRHR